MRDARSQPAGISLIAYLRGGALDPGVCFRAALIPEAFGPGDLGFQEGGDGQ
jgi:hypothetical protein